MYFKFKSFLVLAVVLLTSPEAFAFSLTPSTSMPPLGTSNYGSSAMNGNTLNGAQLQALLQSQLLGQGSADNISLESLQKIQSQAGQTNPLSSLLGFLPQQKNTGQNLSAQLQNMSPEQIMQMLQAGELGMATSSMGAFPSSFAGQSGQTLQMPLAQMPPIVPQMSGNINQNQAQLPNQENTQGASEHASSKESASQQGAPQTNTAEQMRKDPYSFGVIVPGMQPIFNPSMTLNMPPMPPRNRSHGTQNRQTNKTEKNISEAQIEAQTGAQTGAQIGAQIGAKAQDISSMHKESVASYSDRFPITNQGVPYSLVPDNAPLLDNSRLVASNATQAPYFLNAGNQNNQSSQNSLGKERNSTQSAQQSGQNQNTQGRDSEHVNSHGNSHTDDTSSSTMSTITYPSPPPLFAPQTPQNAKNSTRSQEVSTPLTGRRAPHLGNAQDIGIPVLLKEPDTEALAPDPLAAKESSPTESASPAPKTSHALETNQTHSAQSNTALNSSENLELDAVDMDKRAQIQETKSLESVLDSLSLNDLGLRAKSGDSLAQYKLGMQYYLGKKVERDIKTAFYWVEKAANQKYPPAMVQMGRFYESGEFGNANLKKATSWYKKAAELEDADGLYHLARFYDNGTIGKGEEARRLAMGYFRKSANMGHPEALYELAKFYNTKDDATRDMGQAVQLYRNSAHLGYAPAQLEVGILYELGNFLPKDDANAAAWYAKAALQGLDTAQYLLAGMFLEGRGVPKDIEKAIRLYEAAAQQNLVDAQFDLGILYITSDPPYFNKKLAEQWLQKAADNGDMNAFDILQNMQTSKLQR